MSIYRAMLLYSMFHCKIKTACGKLQWMQVPGFLNLDIRCQMCTNKHLNGRQVYTSKGDFFYFLYLKWTKKTHQRKN